MKTSNFFLTACLLGLFACEVSQVEDPDLDGSEVHNEVRALLQANLFMPSGKLKSKDNYQSDENGIHFRNHFFYDKNGNPTLTLGVYQGGHKGNPWFVPGDTTGATAFHYSFGKLTEEKSFDFKSGNFSYRGSIFYNYDSQGRLFQILNSSKEPMITHHYNELGQLQYKKHGKNQDGEIDEFWYDEQGRTIRHIYWGGTAPIFDHFYSYDAQGRLEAKETWSGPDNKEDVFRFFYNEKGQLVEEIEFYPQYGFEQRFKRVYSYYTENPVSGN
jgi:antitoxin component YwqK of YwqJK toxin-antitoxin module